MTASGIRQSISALSLILAALTTSAQQPGIPRAQEVFAAYWTTGVGWETQLQMKNNLASGSLTVTPVLRLASGKEIPLDPVTISSNDAASMWVDEGLLKHAPELLHEPNTYGSVVFRFNSFNAQNLYADAVTSLDGGPIDLHAAAYPAADFIAWPREAGPGSQEGIWWQPRPGGNDVLIVSNSSDKQLPAILWLSDGTGRRWRRAIALAPRQTQRLDLLQLVSASGLSGNYGGIKIESPIYAGALHSIHFSYYEAAKTSAFLKMFNRDPNAKLEAREPPGESRPWSIWGPMLPLENPDSALGLPGGTVLQPAIFVRNTTAKKLAASITLNWRGDSGKGQVKLPELSLMPYATQQLQINAMQKQLGIPRDAHWALVTLTTNAMPDDVIAVAMSYDASGRYGTDAPFTNGLGGYFAGGEWKLDATHNELATVSNGGTKPADALLTLHYDNGAKKYELQQSIAPGEQMWVNLADLVHNRVADRKGNLLPAGLTSVTYDVQDLGSGLGHLMESDLAVDNTWGHHVRGQLGDCCGVQPGSFDPGVIIFDVNSVLDGILGDGYNACTNVEQNVTPLITDWYTGNSAIATASPQTAKGVTPGFTTLDGQGITVDPNCTIVNFQESPGSIYVVNVEITDADLENDAVNVTLSGPSETSGPLLVTAIGGSNKFQASYNGGSAVGPGSYQVSFNRPSMPNDTYTSLTAQWTVNGTPISTNYNLPRSWTVLGIFRHSQYNTPAESVCTGTPQTAWVFTASCQFTQVSLKSDFVSQTYINGSGQSMSNGPVQYNNGSTCSGKYPNGATTQNSFLKVASITGSCGTTVVGGTSVATYPNPAVAGGPYVCQDGILLVTSQNTNQAEKSVADYCPACSSGFNGTNGHIDDYTSAAACSAHSIGDYGNFWTADTH